MRLQYMNMFEYVYLDLYDLYSSIEHVGGDNIAADTAASFGLVMFLHSILIHTLVLLPNACSVNQDMVEPVLEETGEGIEQPHFLSCSLFWRFGGMLNMFLIYHCLPSQLRKLKAASNARLCCNVSCCCLA